MWRTSVAAMQGPCCGKGLPECTKKHGRVTGRGGFHHDDPRLVAWKWRSAAALFLHERWCQSRCSAWALQAWSTPAAAAVLIVHWLNSTSLRALGRASSRQNDAKAHLYGQKRIDRVVQVAGLRSQSCCDPVESTSLFALPHFCSDLTTVIATVSTSTPSTPLIAYPASPNARCPNEPTIELASLWGLRTVLPQSVAPAPNSQTLLRLPDEHSNLDSSLLSQLPISLQLLLLLLSPAPFNPRRPLLRRPRASRQRPRKIRHLQLALLRIASKNCTSHPDPSRCRSRRAAREPRISCTHPSHQ